MRCQQELLVLGELRLGTTEPQDGAAIQLDLVDRPADVEQGLIDSCIGVRDQKHRAPLRVEALSDSPDRLGLSGAGGAADEGRIAAQRAGQSLKLLLVQPLVWVPPCESPVVLRAED